MRRTLAAFAAAALLLGCTTRDGVATLDAFARARRTRPAIVDTTDGGHARIDPLSQLRFRRKDGEWTAPIYGSDLLVSARGAFREGGVGLDEMDAALVAGLDDERTKLLRVAAARAEVAFEAGAGRDPVRLTGATVKRAFVLFLAAVGHERRAGAAPLAGACTGLGDPFPTCDRDRTLDEATDIQFAFAASLLQRFDPSLLGTWTFFAKGRATAPVAGNHLHALVVSPRAAVIVDGIAWDEVQACEVESLSGGRTLVGFLSLGVLSLALAPVSIAGGGIAGRGRSLEPLRLPAPSVSTTSSSPSSREDGEDLAGGGGVPDTRDAKPLFSAGAVRREWIRFGGTLDTSFDTLGFKRVAQTIVPGVHFFGDIVEFGGGVRIVKSKESDGVDTSTLGVFRFGFHAGVGAARRAAIPFVVEVGGGGDVTFTARLDYGFRYYLGDGRNEVALTVFPFSPVWEARSRHPSRWGAATGAGFLLAY